ncbi:hypothetical protein HanRHA438_Chr14g0649161 [Helianthus annuus]|uniref:Uncharacterized protein n=1 Tax=Helianthus annuus TaxID=4232 RepID=A0A9K3H769_HELAN|nr:hypothetical protein HanXRQr2_Chr14g0638731 [Helianthus annuus]KAJ0468138.1 hypothetical protein HanIR_Chr14g0693091 [Helianthus annuus]KAJ0853269.1 hypothetical protein HanRHA438_Chr14g0649161 [Helianthus annuus]
MPAEFEEPIFFEFRTKTISLLTGASSNRCETKQYENFLSPICTGNEAGPRPNPAIPAGCRVERIEHPTTKSFTPPSLKFKVSDNNNPDVDPDPYCTI